MAQYLVYIPKSSKAAKPCDAKMGVILADVADEAAALAAAAPLMPQAKPSQMTALLLDGTQQNPDLTPMNLVIQGQVLHTGELDRSGGAV